VCCAEDCSGLCQACSEALTSGASGICGPLLPGLETEDECAGPAVCNGAGACDRGVVLLAQTYQGSGEQVAHDVAVDAQGHIFVVGSFAGQLDFGDGTLQGGNLDKHDIFQVRFDPGFQAPHSQKYGSPEHVEALRVDSCGTELVVAGRILGDVNVGGGAALVHQGNGDLYVARYHADFGHIWSSAYGDGATQRVTDVLCDAGTSAVFVAGTTDGSIDFGGAASVTSVGESDGYVARLTAGAGDWATHFGGSVIRIAAMALDGIGGVWVLGDFTGSQLDVDDGGLLLSAVVESQRTGFVVELDVATGAPGRSTTFGGQSANFGDNTGGLLYDANGPWLHLAGAFSGTVVFESPFTASDQNVFMSRWAPSSQSWMPTDVFSGPATDAATATAMGADGLVAVVGDYVDQLGFGSLPTMSGANHSGVFAGKLTPGDRIHWARGFYGSDAAHANGTAVDGADNQIVVGTFKGNIDFGRGPVSASDSGIFMLLLSP
jgi:hypothetical protein